MSTIDILITAIKERQEISFTYMGFNRVAQPAAVGLSKGGDQILRCYQTDRGYLDLSPGHEWDLCMVATISKLKTTGNIFPVNPPLYWSGDKSMSRIFEELEVMEY